MKNKKAKSSLVEGPRPVTEMSLGEIQGYISMHETNIEGSKRKLEELKELVDASIDMDKDGFIGLSDLEAFVGRASYH